jgi:hypothetical protein
MTGTTIHSAQKMLAAFASRDRGASTRVAAPLVS